MSLEADAVGLLRELLRLSPSQRSEPELMGRVRAVVARADSLARQDREDTRELMEWRRMIRSLDLPEHLKEKS